MQKLKTVEEHFPILFTFAREKIPDIQGMYLYNDFENPNLMRMELRKYLSKKLKGPFNGDPLDLNIPPSHTEYSISISHTSKVATVFYSKSHHIGFDIEETDRIEESLIRRVSSKEEQEKFSKEKSIHIWSIKESAFKAFSQKENSSIRVMTDVTIHSMETLDKGVYVYSVGFNNFKAKGFSLIRENHTLALTYLD